MRSVSGGQWRREIVSQQVRYGRGQEELPDVAGNAVPVLVGQARIAVTALLVPQQALRRLACRVEWRHHGAQRQRRRQARPG
jgi:hypothetical protein